MPASPTEVWSTGSVLSTRCRTAANTTNIFAVETTWGHRSIITITAAHQWRTACWTTPTRGRHTTNMEGTSEYCRALGSIQSQNNQNYHKEFIWSLLQSYFTTIRRPVLPLSVFKSVSWYFSLFLRRGCLLILELSDTDCVYIVYRLLTGGQFVLIDRCLGQSHSFVLQARLKGKILEERRHGGVRRAGLLQQRGGQRQHHLQRQVHWQTGTLTDRCTDRQVCVFMSLCVSLQTLPWWASSVQRPLRWPRPLHQQ